MTHPPALTELDVGGKAVFLRCSFDVPLDSTKKLLDPKRVRDDSRIRDPLPTISYLIRNGAKIILAGGYPESDDVPPARSSEAGSFVKKPYTLLDMGIAVKEELENEWKS